MIIQNDDIIFTKSNIKNSKMLYEIEKKELEYRFGKKNIPRKKFPTMFEYLQWKNEDENDYRNFKKTKENFQMLGDLKKEINKIDRSKNRFTSESKDQFNIKNLDENIVIKNLNKNLPKYFIDKPDLKLEKLIEKKDKLAILNLDNVGSEYKQEIAVLKNENLEKIIDKNINNENNKKIEIKKDIKNKENNSKIKVINIENNVKDEINKKLNITSPKTEKINNKKIYNNKKFNKNKDFDSEKNKITVTKKPKILYNNKKVNKTIVKNEKIKKNINSNNIQKIQKTEKTVKNVKIVKNEKNNNNELDINKKENELNEIESIFIKKFEERLNKSKLYNPKLYKNAEPSLMNDIPYAGIKYYSSNIENNLKKE